MIYSTGLQYKAIKEALTQLDTPPTQVLVEASIVEVTLSDSLKYGLEWTFNGQLGNSRFDGTGVLSDGAFNFGGGGGGSVADGVEMTLISDSVASAWSTAIISPAPPVTV